MAKLKKLNIAYWFGFIDKSKTDQMVSNLDMLLNGCERDIPYTYRAGISQFNAVDPTELLQALEETVTLSITLMERSAYDNDRYLKETITKKEAPKFNSEDSEDILQSSVFSFSKPESFLNEIIEKIEQINLSHYLRPSPTKFLLKSKEPFSAGTQRFAYHAQDKSSHERYVIKESKYKMSIDDEKREYEIAVQITGVASMFADCFNAEKPSHIPKVCFVEVHYFLHTKESHGHLVQELFLFEKYIEGSYSKYNTNSGWVNQTSDLYSETLQAFSHYSWVKSGKNLVICDLQGVVQDQKIILTDPAIHCRVYEKFQPNHGGSNLGSPGIELFFKSHKCNDVCLKMKLPPFTK